MNSHIANNYFDDMKVDDHIHKEKTRKASISEFIVALVIAVVMVWSIYYLADPATLPIRQVRIEGEFRQLSTDALQELVKHKVRGGFFNIDVAAVRQAVMEEPWVRDVSVHRVWPDSLRVSVKEQIAVARWKNTGLLNETGKLFTPDKHSFPNNLPILRGPNGAEELMMARYTRLNQLLSVLDLKLVLLQLNERRSWMFKLDNALQVVIGRSNFNDRVTRFIQLVPVALGSKLSQARQIDMRYTNGFTVQWHQDDVLTNEESGA